MTKNTLLIYPPSIYETIYPLLGIPQLIGYLNSKGIENVYSKDLSMDNSFFENLMKDGQLTYKDNLHGVLESLDKYVVKDDYLSEKIKDMILDNNIEILGFSILYNNQLLYSLIMAKVAKRINKDIKIILGGYQIGRLIKQLVKYENLKDIVDYMIIDAGEEAIEGILNKEEPHNIPNLYYKNSENTGFIKSNKNSSLKHSNIATPNFDGFQEYFDKYKEKKLPIRSSIGCAWSKCSFCSFRLSHKNNEYVAGNVKKTIETIVNLKKKYNINDFIFIDDQLTPKFIEEFSQEIIDRKMDIKWISFVALFNTFLDKKLIKKMKQSGCQEVMVGFESSSDRILKMMDKPHNAKDGIKIMELFSKHDIKVTASIIFGFPTETQQEAQKTLDFLIDNFNIYDKVHISLFEIYENTHIFQHPEKYGIKHISKNPNNKNFIYEYEVESGMSHDEAKEFMTKVEKELAKEEKRQNIIKMDKVIFKTT